MPAELWVEAADLAGRLGVYAVARALRLNYGSLKTRADRRRRGGREGASCEGGFVELSGAQILGTPPGTGAAVEIVEESGARLTVRLAEGDDLDLAKLVEAFRGRGA